MVKFTYKGWIGWCPIYLGEDLQRPYIIKRKRIPQCWLDINAILAALFGRGSTSIRITGKLKQPIEVPSP